MNRPTCDFCHNEIKAGEGEISYIISYLPCFHVICIHCKASHFHGNGRSVCIICNGQSTASELFDLVMPDPARLICTFCNSKATVSSFCRTCDGQFLCPCCALPHRQMGHLLNEAKIAIPPRSQCAHHPSIQATFLCTCGMRLCDGCAATHGIGIPFPTGHSPQHFATLATMASQQMMIIKQASYRETASHQKQIPLIQRQKVQLRESASRARTAVALEVVELCNALMRRANDIVTCIDMEEDAGMKRLSKKVTDMSFVQDRLQQVERFLSIATNSIANDTPGAFQAWNFASSAYTRLDQLKQQPQGKERPPSINYVSELTFMLNCIQGHGNLDIDGVVKTLPAATPQGARMFSMCGSQSKGAPINQASTSSQMPIQRQLSQQEIQMRAMQQHQYQQQQHSVPNSPVLLSQFATQRNGQQHPHPHPHQPQPQPQQQPYGHAPLNHQPMSFGFPNPNSQQPSPFMQMAPHFIQSPPPPTAVINNNVGASVEALINSVHGPSSSHHNHHSRSSSRSANILSPPQSIGRVQIFQNPLAPMMNDDVAVAVAVTPPQNGPVNTAPNGHVNPDSTTINTSPIVVMVEATVEVARSSDVVGQSEKIGVDTATATANNEEEPPPPKRRPNHGDTNEQPANTPTARIDENGVTSSAVDTTDTLTNQKQYPPIKEEQSDFNEHSRVGIEVNDQSAAPTTSANPAAEQEDDRWDDYCFVCEQGCDEKTGDLGCCASCPKVFHNHCHCPSIQEEMKDLPDDWTCSICVDCNPLTTLSSEFGEREKLLCAKTFLACFNAAQREIDPFRKEVPTSTPNYYKIINKPIHLELIAERVSGSFYKKVEEFIEDMNQLFKNSSTYNLPTDDVAIAGRTIYKMYVGAIKKFLPAYDRFVWIYVNLHQLSRISQSVAHIPVSALSAQDEKAAAHLVQMNN